MARRVLGQTRREIALSLARVAGYHGDTATFTRLLVEERVNRAAMNAAWQSGVFARGTGARCDCLECREEKGETR